MDVTSAIDILDFVTEAGLRGLSEAELVRGSCERLRSAGVPIARVMVLIDTLHPVHEGHAFRWRRDGGDFKPVTEYGRLSEGGDAAQKWAESPFNHLLISGEAELRRRLALGETADFPVLDELRSEGQTDYIALIHRFDEGALGEMDGVYSSWATDAEGGFTDAQLVFLRQVLPAFALALKCVSLARIAETLVQTYLGRDAGRRVLSGRVARGVAERINAVLWYSDLRGFTRIADTVAPHEVIPFLNDYADAIISSVHEAGGDVLKLIGDGTLAIFEAADPGEACASALKAEALMRNRIALVNAQRSARELPITDAYLGLHIGEVFYGNIGSEDRLDFTVVGPAVNETSRVAALCRSVEKDILMSSAFAAASPPEDRARLVSVGRYALRGVERAQELFTLERGLPRP
ncbi:MAG TPA: adenylate/guanylate cyclase domain-containing protein [Microvirga sp.]|nr:adenylate/guanylate cyclase domain-containing protein [Microvirga sp.]